MKYQYFIASRWRNKDSVLELTRKLREKGENVYCFIESEASQKYVEVLHKDTGKQMEILEAIENWREDPRVKELFKGDMNALRESEAVILLLPAGKSSHIEAGVAYGFGKKLILIGEQKETETLYLIFNEVYPGIDDFIASLGVVQPI